MNDFTRKPGIKKRKEDTITHQASNQFQHIDNVKTKAIVVLFFYAKTKLGYCLPLQGENVNLQMALKIDGNGRNLLGAS